VKKAEKRIARQRIIDALLESAPRRIVPKSSEPLVRNPPDLLTPEEIQSLRQEAKEAGAFARKAFAHLRPKT